MCKTMEKLEELIKIRNYIHALKIDLCKDPFGHPRHIDIVSNAESCIMDEILKEVKRYCETK